MLCFYKTMASTLADKLKRHVVVSTAQMVPLYPLLSTADMQIAGHTPASSLCTHATSTAITFLGLGYAYDSLRERSLAFFNADRAHHSNGRTGIHDALYNGVSYALGAVPLYTGGAYMTGEAPVSQKLAISVGTAFVIGFSSGPLVGLSTDILKDWCGVHPCERLHPVVRNRTPRQKKRLITLALAASLGLSALNYIPALENDTTSVHHTD